MHKDQPQWRREQEINKLREGLRTMIRGDQRELIIQRVLEAAICGDQRALGIKQVLEAATELERLGVIDRLNVEEKCWWMGVDWDLDTRKFKEV